MMPNMIVVLLILATSSYTVKCDLNYRGICKKMRVFYRPEEVFQCFDKSKYINISQVNDNYCDCLDGSDEPGTSACNNGVFCCRNPYFHSKMIPSSLVDDRICDCCDGSDEKEGLCPNTCKLLFEEEFGKLKEEFNKIQSAKHECQRYIDSGKYSPSYYHKEIEIYKNDEIIYKNSLSNYEKLKEELNHNILISKNNYIEQNQEKILADKIEYFTKLVNEIFSLVDHNNNSIIEYTELFYLLKFLDKDQISKDELIINLATNETYYDMIRENFESISVDKLEIEQNSYKENINSTFQVFNKSEVEHQMDRNDSPIVEDEENNIHQSSENGTTKTNFPGWNSPFHETNENITIDDHDLDDDDENIEHENNEESAYHTESQHVTYENKNLFSKWTALVKVLKELSSNKFSIQFPVEIIEKEAELLKIDESIQLSRKQIEHINEDISILKSFENIDFGPKRVYSLLFHECYIYRTSKVEFYEVCPFKYIKQSRNGVNITLGYYDKWISSQNENDQYKTMHFSHGEKCYGDLSRSANIHLICGHENRVISVSENPICQYEIEFETVASCYHATLPHLDETIYHEEL